MTEKKYTVDLTEDERTKLEEFISGGEHRAQAITRARILLKVDDGWSDPEVKEALDCGRSTAKRMRVRYTEDGLAAIHRREPDRDYDRKLDGDEEAHLIALACSEPPDGRSDWTLRVLADKLVMLEEIDHESISHETVRQVLKKTNSNHIAQNNG
jgi:transposase